jgi:2-polyprenyl-3-methyl-5-hydroxy-6-metoxy-1,4-benzoquinol methylase
MKIKKCRSCQSQNLQFLFSLGRMSFTGKFSAKYNKSIPKDMLSLVICKKCKLVQLDRNFNPKFLYSEDYGYRTGINKTMTNHVKSIVREAINKVKPKNKDYILDIASNDGTLLNFYDKKFNTVGIDPLVNKYRKNYKKINKKISDFFSYGVLKKNKIDKKFKIITALSMFYDLKNPNLFLKDLKKVLHKDGIFFLEHADLLSIIKNCLFDTICHEHLEYYSTKVIIDLMKKNNLRVFDIKQNKINGGSLRYLICHDEARYKENKNKISLILKEEKKINLENKKTFTDFFNKINFVKKNTNKLILSILNNGKTIHGYGASTKGNVLLQYFNINNKLIPFIADRNNKKFNFFTPGTKIKIVSEKLSRKMKPDYYLVLPWHFKEEIIKRESKIIKQGTKFIFPLPKLTVL